MVIARSAYATKQIRLTAPTAGATCKRPVI
jgi:hypothetical protein